MRWLRRRKDPWRLPALKRFGEQMTQATHDEWVAPWHTPGDHAEDADAISDASRNGGGASRNGNLGAERQ
jgi:general stress protein YciG